MGGRGGKEPEQSVGAREWRRTDLGRQHLPLQLRALGQGPANWPESPQRLPSAHRQATGRKTPGGHNLGVKDDGLLKTPSSPLPSHPKAQGERRPRLMGGASSLADASGAQLSVCECARVSVCACGGRGQQSAGPVSVHCRGGGGSSTLINPSVSGRARVGGFGLRGSVLHIHTAGRAEGSGSLSHTAQPSQTSQHQSPGPLRAPDGGCGLWGEAALLRQPLPADSPGEL